MITAINMAPPRAPKIIYSHKGSLEIISSKNRFAVRVTWNQTKYTGINDITTEQHDIKLETQKQPSAQQITQHTAIYDG